MGLMMSSLFFEQDMPNTLEAIGAAAENINPTLSKIDN